MNKNIRLRLVDKTLRNTNFIILSNTGKVKCVTSEDIPYSLSKLVVGDGAAEFRFQLEDIGLGIDMVGDDTDFMKLQDLALQTTQKFCSTYSVYLRD
jgi:hypothetical protein